MKNALVLTLVLTLAGCGGNGFNALSFRRNAAEPPAADPAAATPSSEGGETAANGDGTVAETAAPPASGVRPATDASTAEQFDTTTAADRQAALDTTPVSPATNADGRIGTTVASIGDPAEPGFWIKTPLVSARQPGRLYFASTGRSVQVQLIPSGGGAGSGSQVSLAAMRLLGAPLTGLPEIVVYAN